MRYLDPVRRLHLTNCECRHGDHFSGIYFDNLAIAVTNDTIVESQEELRLSLSNPQNAVLGRSTVSAYITDGEKILDNAAQKAILVNNVFKDSKTSINEYIKGKLDSSSVTISGISYTYSQVLINKSVTSDVYAYVDSIVDDYEVMAKAIISAIMTKSDAYVDVSYLGLQPMQVLRKPLLNLTQVLRGLMYHKSQGLTSTSMEPIQQVRVPQPFRVR